jgi:hypothetical protein
LRGLHRVTLHYGLRAKAACQEERYADQ